MAEGQQQGTQERSDGSGIFDALQPDVALRTLSNLQLEDSRLLAPLKIRSRLANQVYDLLQSFLTGARSSKDTFYPSLQDIYGDLQMHKRAISDKTPMPTEEELVRTVCFMSVQTPPFLHILREIPTNATSPERFITRLVAPTEKHPDKVSVGYRATIRNNLVKLKSLMNDLDPALPGGPAFHRIQDADPRTGRVETILGKMFFNSLGPPLPDEDGQHDDVTLRRVNQGLRMRLFRPLVLDLLREKMIFSISCQDLRNHSGLKVPDIVLFNILENIKHRFGRLCEILTHEAVLELLTENARSQAKRFLGNNLLQDAAESVAHSLLEDKSYHASVPFHILETAAEMVRLREWYDEKSKSTKQDQQKQEIQQVLKKLQNQNGIFRAKNGRKYNIDEKYVNLFLNEKGSPVLCAAHPPLARTGTRDSGDYETIYLLFKDRTVTGNAIQGGLEAYKKTGDTFLLRLLEDLLAVNTTPDSELKAFVPPAYIEQLREAIRDSYKAYLSPLERIWLAITGKRISDAKILRIQQRLDADRQGGEKARAEKKSRSQTRKAKKEVRSLARQRAGESEPMAAPSREESASFGHEAQELLAYLLTQVNMMWDKNYYPTREQVLRLATAAQKEVAEKVIGLVDAGAQSTSALIRIPVPGKGHVYGGRDYVHGSKEELIAKFKRKLEDDSVVDVGGTKLQLTNKEDDRTLSRAMLQYLNHI